MLQVRAVLITVGAAEKAAHRAGMQLPHPPGQHNGPQCCSGSASWKAPIGNVEGNTTNTLQRYDTEIRQTYQICCRHFSGNEILRISQEFYFCNSSDHF